jgi:hypothetical protein
MNTKNILFTLKFLLFLIIVSACSKNKLKEIVTYKINYSYNSETSDSTKILLEQQFFNSDSIIIKSINHKNGYFYIADYNKWKRRLSKKFFSSDSTFLYGSISQLNRDKLETKIEFLDSLNNVTYMINWQYKKNTNQVQKQINNFSDGSVQEMDYSYDKFGNLIQKRQITSQDTAITEFHQMSYNASGQIVNDTIYYPEARKIVFNEYKMNLLFYTTEKFEAKSDTGIHYFPISKAYWKKYFLYDENGRLFEIRNIKMSQDSKSFRLDSKEMIIYSQNGLVQQKTLYNSENKKVYSLITDYIY